MDTVVLNLKFARQFVAAYAAERAESANAEQAGRLSPADRSERIENRVAAMLADRIVFRSLVAELMAGPLSDIAADAMRDAIEQEGDCWDGISTFGDMIHTIARARAAKELQ